MQSGEELAKALGFIKQALFEGMGPALSRWCLALPCVAVPHLVLRGRNALCCTVLYGASCHAITPRLLLVSRVSDPVAMSHFVFDRLRVGPPRQPVISRVR